MPETISKTTELLGSLDDNSLDFLAWLGGIRRRHFDAIGETPAPNKERLEEMIATGLVLKTESGVQLNKLRFGGDELITIREILDSRNERRTKELMKEERKT